VAKGQKTSTSSENCLIPITNAFLLDIRHATGIYYRSRRRWLSDGITWFRPDPVLGFGPVYQLQVKVMQQTESESPQVMEPLLENGMPESGTASLQIVESVQEKGMPPPEPESPQASEQTPKPILLIADDEEIIRARLADMGAMLGFNACAARDGAEALQIFQQMNPDIVILDIYMPRMNGLTVMQKIKETKPDCPVILITGFMHFEQLVHKNHIKPDGFISKPFNLNTVIVALLKLVLNKGIKLS
jgi:CheY-like chemotaxis protein